MHPGYMWYWKQRQGRGAPCGAYASAAGWCGPAPGDGSEAFTSTASSRSSDRIFGGGGFGVRRPVRFLAARLDLDDKQLSSLARIVERIRIEREQAAVDLRRAVGAFADALEGDAFGDTALESAAERRLEAAKSVQEAVSTGLRELHALLDPDQREELASLIRTGAVRL